MFRRPSLDEPSQPDSYGVLGLLMDRAGDAYRAARPVIDKYPGGLPHRDELPDRERALLDDLDRADAAVKRHRQRSRIRGARLLTD